MKERLTGVLIAAFFAVVAGTGLAEAIGEREGHYAKPVCQHAGDGRQLYRITCSSATNVWTLAISSEPASRAVAFFAVAANTAGVCLSSSTSSGVCDDDKEGVEITPGAAFTDRNIAEWRCASRAGNADKLKIYRSLHLKDIGLTD